MIRVPRNAKHDAQPIVFLHGLGLGLTQYQVFLSHLLKAVPDRPILVPLQPHVSQEIFHPRYLKPMGRHATAKALAGLLVELGWAEVPVEESGGEDATAKDPSGRRGVTVVSHSKWVFRNSYHVPSKLIPPHSGSFLHAWLLKAHPDMIIRSCFVDPVTFCSWEGGALSLVPLTAEPEFTRGYYRSVLQLRLPPML